MTHLVDTHVVGKVTKLDVMTSLDNGGRLNAKQYDTVARIMHPELEYTIRCKHRLERPGKSEVPTYLLCRGDY